MRSQGPILLGFGQAAEGVIGSSEKTEPAIGPGWPRAYAPPRKARCVKYIIAVNLAIMSLTSQERALREAGQAGALSQSEICITPAMVTAGYDVAREFFGDLTDTNPPARIEAFVSALYSRMVRAM